MSLLCRAALDHRAALGPHPADCSPAWRLRSAHKDGRTTPRPLTEHMPTPLPPLHGRMGKDRPKDPGAASRTPARSRTHPLRARTAPERPPTRDPRYRRRSQGCRYRDRSTTVLPGTLLARPPGCNRLGRAPVGRVGAQPFSRTRLVRPASLIRSLQRGQCVSSGLAFVPPAFACPPARPASSCRIVPGTRPSSRVASGRSAVPGVGQYWPACRG